jgi:hypothetical protein
MRTPGGNGGALHEGCLKLPLELPAERGDRFAGARCAQLLLTDATHALHLP